MVLPYDQQDTGSRRDSEIDPDLYFSDLSDFTEFTKVLLHLGKTPLKNPNGGKQLFSRKTLIQQ